ncbi:MAG: dihydroorotate dehydrogenase electron transfer subunit [Spirochaetes bacterium]|nr:dihydroorotate dehydrogenase electron transfer subunit [Spirochaetota bacterium]
MKDQKLEIIKNKNIKNDFYKIVFKTEDFENCTPGQFINILISEKQTPFLRRPFSIYESGDNKLSVIYRKVGPGTELLSKKKEGEKLNILGPLGRPFPDKSGDTILIAGGVGIPPIAYLGRELKKSGKKIISCIGFKNKDLILLEETFNLFSDQLIIATDDGSYGIKGTVINALNKLKEIPQTAYACGPTPMLRAVKEWAKKKNVAAYLSLEEYMGCGYGICLSCVVKHKNGKYVCTCKEGPVFEAQDVKI